MCTDWFCLDIIELVLCGYVNALLSDFNMFYTQCNLLPKEFCYYYIYTDNL